MNSASTTLIIAAATLIACRPATSENPPDPPQVPTNNRTVPPEIETPPPPVFAGSPVAVTPAEVLHHSDAHALRVLRQRWKLDGTTGVVWLVSVPRDAEARVAHSADVVPFVDLLPPDDGPWAAINGGFYEAVPNGPNHRAMGLVISDGHTESKRTTRGGSGIFLMDSTGPKIVHRKKFRPAGVSQALQSIDRIVDGGTSLVKRRPDQPGAMRSAIALTEDRMWLVAAVADADIREVSSGIQLRRSHDGLPLWAFAAYLIDTLEVTEALNLDGGVSTQIAVRDGDFHLDVRGVRGTINAIVLRPSPR